MCRCSKWLKSLGMVLVCIFVAQGAFANASPFKLQPGDLLFQDLNCGTLCDGIGEVTHGINNTYMSHVGIVISVSHKHTMVIEALSKGVVTTPLQTFLARSLDAQHHPRVLVERLKPQYQYLIPQAIKYAKQQLGKPYNATFVPNNEQSYYCSSLIYSAFLYANDNHNSIFHTHAMSFKDPHTQVTTHAWQEYFRQLHATPSEGMIGSNPGMMSRESALTVVHVYGKLRVHPAVMHNI